MSREWSYYDKDDRHRVLTVKDPDILACFEFPVLKFNTGGVEVTLDRDNVSSLSDVLYEWLEDFEYNYGGKN